MNRFLRIIVAGGGLLVPLAPTAEGAEGPPQLLPRLPDLTSRAYRDPYDPSPAPYLFRPPRNARENQERDLLPQTRAALHRALDGLGIDWFISQGIANDRLSAGTHRPDGRGNGHYYSAAVDITINGLTSRVPSGSCSASQRRAGRCLTSAHNAQFARLTRALRNAGFAAWYRNFYDQQAGRWQIEIHAIDPIAPYIKPSLRRQLDAYIQGRDGLVGNRAHDAAGRVTPNRAAFCRRAAQRGSVKGYSPFGSGYTAYRCR